MKSLDHTYAVILAGGGGTRLWPKSRLRTPKQFLKLTAEGTMLQVTAERFAKMVPWNKIIVVTGKKHARLVKKQLPELPEKNILSEPSKRDTAMAMLVGALYAQAQDPEAIVVNDAADHVIRDEQEFLKLMKAAVQVAASGDNLVAVGITPTSPSSAFGYIKVGREVKKVDDSVPVFKVESFTEKPDRVTAKAFISTGKYFWNANHYVWSAKSLQKAFKTHLPEMHAVTKKLSSISSHRAFTEALTRIYKKVPSISIDYAVSEKADNLLLIPGDFGWEDIGEWRVVYELGTKDLSGNVVVSDGTKETLHTLSVESKNNLIHVGDRLVALIGVNDMIIVDTGEILMIAPMKRSQEVKKLVTRLKEEGKEEYL